MIYNNKNKTLNGELNLKKRFSLITLTLALGMFLWSFSAGIINISLPVISQFLDLGTDMVSLIIIIHLIVLISFLLIFGRLGETIGYKKVYIAGLSLFTLGSYLCGISLDFSQIIIFRIIQGIGSAMLISMVTAMISSIYPYDMRGRIFGYISVTTTLGITAGYGIGGYITEYAVWNWIFFAVVPLGLISIYMAAKIIPSFEKKIKSEKFDFTGSILILISLIALVIPLMNIGEDIIPDLWPVIISIAIFFSSGILFFIWESKNEHPLLDISILKNFYITVSLLTGFLATLVLMGTIFLLPFYLELIMNYSPALTGLIILTQSVVVIVIGPLSGYISDKVGSRVPTIFAGFSLVMAICLLTIFNETIGLTFIIVALCIRALSEGMFTPANNKMVMSHSPNDKIGPVSSLLNTARYLGLVLGIILFNAIFNKTISLEASKILGTPLTGAFHLSTPNSILLQGFHNTFILGIIISVFVLLFTILAKENRHMHENSTESDYKKELKEDEFPLN